MNRYRALIYREWLENRSALGWLPIGVTLLFIAFGLIAASLNGSWFTEQAPMSSDVGGPALRHFLHFIARPGLTLLFLTTAFYLLGTLFEERRDRSILFWKALPVSDFETVLSKVAVALIVTPAVAFASIVLLQLSATALVAAYCPCEPGEAALIWSEAQLASSGAHLAIGLVTQSLWWLPLWSWLLLVSATAPRLPVLWAIVLPVLLSVLERVTVGTTALWQILEQRLDAPALPDYGALPEGGSAQTVTLADTLAVWTGASFWLGLVAAFVLLALTVGARRRLNEL